MLNSIQKNLAKFAKADNKEKAAIALNSILYAARKSKVVDFVYFSIEGSLLLYGGSKNYAMNVHNGNIYKVYELSFDSKGLPLQEKHANKKALLPSVGAAGGIGRITYAKHASSNRARLTDSALRGSSTNYSGNIKIVQGTVSIADTDKYGRIVSSAVGYFSKSWRHCYRWL